MRLFLAFVPSKEVREIFRKDRAFLKKKLRNNVSFVPVDQVHLLVKFVGESVSEGGKEILIDHLSRNVTKFSQVDIKFDKLTFGYRSQSKPRVLKYDIELGNGFKDLENSVHEVVRGSGLHDVLRQKERNTPHITLGRVKTTASSKVVKEIFSLLKELNRDKETSEFRADKFVLFESILTRSGTQLHKPIWTLDLV